MAREFASPAMARSYKRDKNGKFSGTGGGGSGKKASGAPKSKSAETRAANKATTDRLLGKGLTGTGSRLRSKNQALFSGTKATKERNEGLFRAKEGNQRRMASGTKYGAQRSTAGVRGTVKRRGR